MARNALVFGLVVFVLAWLVLQVSERLCGLCGSARRREVPGPRAGGGARRHHIPSDDDYRPFAPGALE